MESIDYLVLRDKLTTGDLAFFAGSGAFSWGIKRLSRSRWSHVGVIVVDAATDTVLLWESDTTEDVRDVTTARFERGVRIVEFSEKLRLYPGPVAVRRRQAPFRDVQRTAFKEVRDRLKGLPYEEDLLELILAAYDGPFGQNTEDLQSIFCSEAAAVMLQAVGDLNPARASNEFTPGDLERHELLPYAPAVLLNRVYSS